MESAPNTALIEALQEFGIKTTIRHWSAPQKRGLLLLIKMRPDLRAEVQRHFNISDEELAEWQRGQVNTRELRRQRGLQKTEK